MSRHTSKNKALSSALYIPTLLVLALVCSRGYSQTCSVNAEIDPPTTGTEHTIPAQFLPQEGPGILIGTTPEEKTQGQVRVVGFSAFPKSLAQLVSRKYVRPPGISGTMTIGVAAVDGKPTRTPPDGFDIIGANMQPSGFRYRLELCVKGKWEYITSPETDHVLRYSEQYQDDLLTVTYGSKQDHQTSQNAFTTVIFAFKPKEAEVHVSVKQKTAGICGAAAYSGDSVRGFVVDHQTGQPMLVKNLGVSMIFDGTTEITPQPGHGSITLPGGDPLNPGPGYVDTFPYGKVSKAASDTSSVTVEDDSFGINIGGPCRPFTGVVRAIMYDGQVVVSKYHL